MGSTERFFEAIDAGDADRVRSMVSAGVELARLLLDRGADVDARGRGWMTGTPLNSAASGRHADVARLLLDSCADRDARKASGWTPLHSATHNGDLELVELLLAHGPTPPPANDDGVTVLSMAEEGRNADIVARVRAALAP